MISSKTINSRSTTFQPLSIVESPSILADRFYFRSKGFFKIVRIANIRHVEAKQGYLDLHTTEGLYRGLPLKLKSFSTQTNSTLLLRVHRSYIVNVLYVNSFSKNEIHIDMNGDTLKIPIGTTYQEDVFSFLVSNIQRLMMD